MIFYLFLKKTAVLATNFAIFVYRKGNLDLLGGSLHICDLHLRKRKAY